MGLTIKVGVAKNEKRKNSEGANAQMIEFFIQRVWCKHIQDRLYVSLIPKDGYHEHVIQETEFGRVSVGSRHPIDSRKRKDGYHMTFDRSEGAYLIPIEDHIS